MSFSDRFTVQDRFIYVREAFLQQTVPNFSISLSPHQEPNISWVQVRSLKVTELVKNVSGNILNQGINSSSNLNANILCD